MLSPHPIGGAPRISAMVKRSTQQPRPERPPTVRSILRVWHADRIISEASARQYLGRIASFRRYCVEFGLREVDELTLEGARRFKSWCAQRRRSKTGNLGNASSALRALRRVYEVMDTQLPPWQSIKRHAQPASAILRDYAAHLAQHRGNPEVTVQKKLHQIGMLFEHLAATGKSWRQIGLPDIDEFLIQCAHGYSRATTADIASTVRSFSRFLLVSGRVDVDLADAVISPVQPRFERPRRAWPWEDVQRLLRAVDTSTARGLRDHALLLMMSTYGLGAGEVIRLQLQDIDWSAGTLQMTRPKTGVSFVLPLLPAVGKVLARYLRQGRPLHTPTRHVFVQVKVPFGALTCSSAVRHILVKHAKAASIQADYLGTHVLRYSNAARQVDIGTDARVLTELLGHRDSESLSTYVRIATESLREVSLPVPR
jgi:site-specific recombinase XerD